MCLLIAYLAGARPDPAALSRAAARNPDGYGWAIVSGGEIISHRTLDASEGIASFVEARSRHLDGPAIWHARIGTHGALDLENCHPFSVAGDSRVVLGHNGMLPLSASKGRSDTRILCEEMLRPSDLDHPGAMYWLGEWAAGSKLAILSARPDTASSLYLVNEYLGEWSDVEPGVWYSNRSHADIVPISFSADPRLESSKPKKTVGVLYDSTGLDVGDDSSPWDYYGPANSIIECDICGELWPDFCDWCETCGADLDGCEVISYDYLDGDLDGGEQ